MTRIVDELHRLERLVSETAHARKAPEHFAAWRDVLRYYQEVSHTREDPEPAKGEADYGRLWEFAKQAMANLGGQGEPSLETLADYDSERNGPLLGVSNEGGATAAIRHGALAAPRCQVSGDRTPLAVGVALDAERLGAIGEVVVGPDEFADIRLACRGRLLTTTNVGTRVNARNYLPPPVVQIKTGRTADAVVAGVKGLQDRFEPYRKTAGYQARALTVLIRFSDRIAPSEASEIFGRLSEAVASGDFCEPHRHHIGLVVTLKGGPDRLSDAKAAIDLAGRCRLDSVTLDGPALTTDRESAPAGLLNCIPIEQLGATLAYAREKCIKVVPFSRLDPQTTARHIWSGLSVVRNMGFELGKYGLAPLTLPEQKEVIARIQYWFPQWCAAPVCYIDFPVVTATEIYHDKTLANGIKEWLAMVARLRVRVVLIDTAKKSEGRRLLKDDSADDKGFLSLDEVRDFDAYGKRLGLKVLWAGGITMAQSYKFGKLGVFGIYVTSAAASPGPLGKHYRRDPGLLFSRAPHPEAVARVKLLLEAGFLAGRLSKAKENEIERFALDLVQALAGKADLVRKSTETLRIAVENAWRTKLGKRGVARTR
ncbi:MAG TPA: hypothetical protein VH592_01150 [Gemmataceae bacterium]|jgi:hypothetical protein